MHFIVELITRLSEELGQRALIDFTTNFRYVQSGSDY